VKILIFDKKFLDNMDKHEESRDVTMLVEHELKKEIIHFLVENEQYIDFNKPLYGRGRLVEGRCEPSKNAPSNPCANHK